MRRSIQVRRVKQRLTNMGLYLTEISAWGEPEAAALPWYKALLRSRRKPYFAWVNDIMGDKTRAFYSPDQIRRSLSLQRRVRQWYLSHGWIKKCRREGRDTFRIDPWAAMRYFCDEWHKSPDGRGKDSPWKERKKDIRHRQREIDSRFPAAKSLERI